MLNQRNIQESQILQGVTFSNDCESYSAKDFYSQFIMGGSSEMNCMVADLTPELATVLLSNNKTNRQVSKPKLKKYIRDMRSGRWIDENGQTIVISKCGQLNDGQHRCLAVIETGITVRAVFVWGVTRASRKTLDQGLHRAVSHQLMMDGVDNPSIIATASKILAVIENGRPIKSSRGGKTTYPYNGSLTSAEVNEYATVNHDEMQSAHSSVCVAKRGGTVSVGVLTAARVLIGRECKDEEAIDDFFEMISFGVSPIKNKSISFAVQKLLSFRDNGSDKSRGYRIEIILKAWNRYRMGNHNMGNYLLKLEIEKPRP